MRWQRSTRSSAVRQVGHGTAIYRRTSSPWPRGDRRAGPRSYDAVVQPPETGDEWFAISAVPLPVGAVYEWAIRPDCGAVVLFSGTVRDHAEGRDGVEHLEYEAYESAALERFAAIAAEARHRWPAIGRVALLHRIGRLDLGESAVIAAVSSPHRPEAFDAARYAIDTLKVAAPIWKHETWSEGAGWGTDASAITDVAAAASASASGADRRS